MDEQEEQVEEQEESLEKVHEKLAACEDKYLRLLADSENARKRMQKERQDLMQYAVENVLAEFLHPLDNFENALRHAENVSEEVKNWAIGFEMIAGQFKQVLLEHGVEEYHSVGKQFDPHLHEAVEMIETIEKPAGEILEQCVSGYKKGDRTIRVARVKVAKPPEEKGENNG